MEIRLNVTRFYSLFEKKVGGWIVTIPKSKLQNLNADFVPS